MTPALAGSRGYETLVCTEVDEAHVCNETQACVVCVTVCVCVCMCMCVSVLCACVGGYIYMQVGIACT